MVSIPHGNPQPFSLIVEKAKEEHKLSVSIPHGNPQPFSLKYSCAESRTVVKSQSRTGIPSHLAQNKTEQQNNG